MIFRRIFLIIILIISLFVFCACYNTTGIDKQYFVVSLGLDITDQNNLLLSVQIPFPSNNSNSSDSAQSSDYQIYTVEAQTIDEGLSILNNYLNKKINLSHCSALIISEKLALKRHRNLYKYIN